MKTQLILAACSALLWVSCGQSQTEILQDGPWIIDSGTFDNEPFGGDGSTWTFSSDGVFTDTQADNSTTTGTYTFNEEGLLVVVSMEIENIPTTISLTLSTLEENSMVGAGTANVGNLLTVNVSVSASRS